MSLLFTISTLQFLNMQGYNHGSRIMTNNVNRRFPHQLMHSAKGIAALLKPFNRSMFAQIYVNLLQ